MGDAVRLDAEVRRRVAMRRHGLLLAVVSVLVLLLAWPIGSANYSGYYFGGRVSCGPAVLATGGIIGFDNRDVIYDGVGHIGVDLATYESPSQASHRVCRARASGRIEVAFWVAVIGGVLLLLQGGIGTDVESGIDGSVPILFEKTQASNPYLSQVERGLRIPNDAVRDRLIAALSDAGEGP